jgi:hypothetical protein
MPSTNWLERLTGFAEADYESTRSRLRVDGSELVSLVNGARYGIGSLRTPPLAELRANVAIADRGRTTVTCTVGDVGAMHGEPEFEGALFQVASQFNLLEMTHYTVTPENGVTRYAHDHTQGPACAIAAGAGTIYRNYLAPVNGVPGQTADRQLNMLERVGLSLSTHLGRPISSLWQMENGYALCTADGLAAITDFLASASPQARGSLAGELAIGLHFGVEATGAGPTPGQAVSQAYCSALPVAYSNVPQRHWEGFARLVLESAYEANSAGSRRIRGQRRVEHRAADPVGWGSVRQPRRVDRHRHPPGTEDRGARGPRRTVGELRQCPPEYACHRRPLGRVAHRVRAHHYDRVKARFSTGPDSAALT